MRRRLQLYSLWYRGQIGRVKMSILPRFEEMSLRILTIVARHGHIRAH
jgi:hypothetical protein